MKSGLLTYVKTSPIHNGNRGYISALPKAKRIIRRLYQAPLAVRAFDGSEPVYQVLSASRVNGKRIQ